MRAGIRSRMFVLAALTAGLTACGPEVTAGGFREGEVDAIVTSEGGPTGSVAPSAPGPAWSLSGADAGAHALVTGTIAVTAQVALIAPDGSEVRLSPTPSSAGFRIEGADSALLARASVAARRYDRVRVTFTGVTAQVVSGMPVLGEVRVDLSGGPLVVERAASLEVRANARHAVVVDLNAHLWLATAGAGRTVSRTAFESAVEVRVR